MLLGMTTCTNNNQQDGAAHISAGTEAGTSLKEETNCLKQEVKRVREREAASNSRHKQEHSMLKEEIKRLKLEAKEAIALKRKIHQLKLEVDQKYQESVGLVESHQNETKIVAQQHTDKVNQLC